MHLLLNFAARCGLRHISIMTAEGGKFLYFAYGSNLMAERIHLNNPSARRVAPALLRDYRLDFSHWSKRWQGASATVVPDPEESLWGAVWSLDEEDLPSLDRQEGVGAGVYLPIEVEVETPDGRRLACRSYQLCETPERLAPGEEVPPGRRPSEIYWRVILRGAEETGVPEDYMRKLLKVCHNGYRGHVDVPLDRESLLEFNVGETGPCPA